MSSCHITLGRDKLPLTHMSHDNLKGKVNKNHCHESGNQFQIVLEEISGHCVALPGRLGGNLARTPHSPPLCHSWFRSRSSSFLPCTSSFLSFSSFPLPHPMVAGRWSPSPDPCRMAMDPRLPRLELSHLSLDRPSMVADVVARSSSWWTNRSSPGSSRRHAAAR
jgi:hypothetical protein